MTFHSRNNEHGFTIVELLIVIIVIGILATLVLIAYGNVQGQARDTKRQSNAQSVANAAETYKTASATGYYPRMDSSSNFQSDIGTASNYTNGTAAISVDTSVTYNSSSSKNLLTTGGSVTNADGGYDLNVTFCPSSANYQTATGLKVFYWKESSNDGTKFVQTGTGC